eukprot:4833233-Amphidinium_carterae.1
MTTEARRSSGTIISGCSIATTSMRLVMQPLVRWLHRVHHVEAMRLCKCEKTTYCRPRDQSSRGPCTTRPVPW